MKTYINNEKKKPLTKRRSDVRVPSNRSQNTVLRLNKVSE